MLRKFNLPEADRQCPQYNCAEKVVMRNEDTITKRKDFKDSSTMHMLLNFAVNQLREQNSPLSKVHFPKSVLRILILCDDP